MATSGFSLINFCLHSVLQHLVYSFNYMYYNISMIMNNSVICLSSMYLSAHGLGQQSPCMQNGHG